MRLSAHSFLGLTVALSALLIPACGSDDDGGGTGGSATGGGSGSGASSGSGGSTGGNSGSGGSSGSSTGGSSGSGGSSGASGAGGGAGTDGGAGASGSGGTDGGAGSDGGGGSAGTDAGTDAGCAANTVPTKDGCLSCSDASKALNAVLDAARKANAACSTATDCKLIGAGSQCAGGCQLAIAVSGEAAYNAALAQANKDYCSGYVPVCGFITPACLAVKAVCKSNVCETEPA
ncbi:MAG TPA: hypothetical protein PKD61_07345 [Polyangiaceae bacterium]|nr:hypothetical protein [Polyangiaceae bacterium]